MILMYKAGRMVLLIWKQEVTNVTSLTTFHLRLYPNIYEFLFGTTTVF